MLVDYSFFSLSTASAKVWRSLSAFLSREFSFTCENEVAINKLELTKSKKGDPMVTCWMKIVAGEYTNSLIFMNQVVTQGFQIHIVNEFLRALVEHIEPYCELIQNNTDGIIVKLNDYERDFDILDDVVYEWKQRTRYENGFRYFHKYDIPKRCEKGSCYKKNRRKANQFPRTLFYFQ